MSVERVNELNALIKQYWQKESRLHLCQLLQQIAEEAGFEGDLKELSDDVIFYHLKMKERDLNDAIPGLQKDYEADFKTALLRERGLLNE